MALGTLLLSLGLISLADSIGLIAGRSAYGLPSYLKMLESDKREISKECSRYMEPCVPDQDVCCGDLVCRNILRDFCFYPLEQCRCTKLRVFQDMRK